MSPELERGEATRERILSAAIDFMEREGTAKATTRAIAAEAGVNIASINYYFRSKEALVEAALAVTWDNAMEHLRSFLETEPWEPRACLRALAAFLKEGAGNYPTLTRANLFDAGGRPFGVVARGLSELVEGLTTRLCAHRGAPLDEAARNKVHAFLSALVFPLLVPFEPDRLAEPVAWERYLEGLIAELLEGLQKWKGPSGG